MDKELHTSQGISTFSASERGGNILLDARKKSSNVIRYLVALALGVATYGAPAPSHNKPADASAQMTQRVKIKPGYEKIGGAIVKTSDIRKRYNFNFR
jgi:hypothetical protein